MPFENATTIEELNSSWPISSDINNVADQCSFGDDHQRNIKEVLQLIFKGANNLGFEIPIYTTEDSLNFLTGLTGNLQAQITAAKSGSIIIGGVIEYTGLIVDIPLSFSLCDGTNGTPNVSDLFLYGTNVEGEIGNTGGEADTRVISHTHTDSHSHVNAASDTDGEHSHPIPSNTVSTGIGTGAVSGQTAGSTGGQSTSVVASHNHTVTVNNSGFNTSNDGTVTPGSNAPPYLKLAYIQRKY